MTEVAKYVNERKREFENLASLLEIRQRVVGNLDVCGWSLEEQAHTGRLCALAQGRQRTPMDL
jgi:hypothetical protein